VEGDWPDCFRANRFVKGNPESEESARDVLHAFDRWPTWMWANWEVVALLEWTRNFNGGRAAAQRVGFYGLDVYSLWDSLDAVMRYVRDDGEVLRAARSALHCFEPYGDDAITYGRATAMLPTSCHAEVSALLTQLRQSSIRFRDDDPEGLFDAEQNALVVRNAEEYYRTMVRADGDSWNIRDRHMVETLERLMCHHGREAKAIVWEHNTHVGDARATDMSVSGLINVGELVRHGHDRRDVVIVGFGSHRGTVIAGESWNVPMRRMHMPPAQHGSWEDVLQRIGGDQLYIFDDRWDERVTLEPRGHRAIGVVYHPERERWGNYVPTVLPRRYDAFIFLEETNALHPLHMEPHTGHDPPETYPWGV
jgi:erythromycin esterase-like protein